MSPSMAHTKFDRYEALIAAIHNVAVAEILEDQARMPAHEPSKAIEVVDVSPASQKALDLRSHALLAAMLCNTVGEA